MRLSPGLGPRKPGHAAQQSPHWWWRLMQAARTASGIAGLMALLLLASGWTAAASDSDTQPVPAQDLAVLSGMVDALQANGLVSDTLADQARDLFAGSPGIERVKVIHWMVTEEVESRIAAGAP